MWHIPIISNFYMWIFFLKKDFLLEVTGVYMMKL